MRVQVVNYVIFEYSRPQPFEDTDNNVDNVEELTTDRSAATKPSSLSPQPQLQPSGTRIVGERPTTVRAPAAQGGGHKYILKSSPSFPNFPKTLKMLLL